MLLLLLGSAHELLDAVADRQQPRLDGSHQSPSRYASVWNHVARLSDGIDVGVIHGIKARICIFDVLHEPGGTYGRRRRSIGWLCSHLRTSVLVGPDSL